MALERSEWKEFQLFLGAAVMGGDEDGTSRHKIDSLQMSGFCAVRDCKADCKRSSGNCLVANDLNIANQLRSGIGIKIFHCACPIVM